MLDTTKPNKKIVYLQHKFAFDKRAYIQSKNLTRALKICP